MEEIFEVNSNENIMMDNDGHLWLHQRHVVNPGTPLPPKKKKTPVISIILAFYQKSILLHHPAPYKKKPQNKEPNSKNHNSKVYQPDTHNLLTHPNHTIHCHTET